MSFFLFWGCCGSEGAVEVELRGTRAYHLLFIF